MRTRYAPETWEVSVKELKEAVLRWQRMGFSAIFRCVETEGVGMKKFLEVGDKTQRDLVGRTAVEFYVDGLGLKGDNMDTFFGVTNLGVVGSGFDYEVNRTFTDTNVSAEKEVEIVAAIGNRTNIGKDLGMVTGLGKNIGVTIRKDADTVLQETEADIVMMTVGSTMEKMELHFEKCIKNGLNVVTIAEEAFYPYHINGEITQKLDTLAKENNVTISAGGIQDVFWFNMLKTISGACNKIDSVLGIAANNVDEYGPIAAKELGIGCSVNDFKKLMSEGSGEIDFFGIALEAIVNYFGLTISSKKEWIEPVLAHQKIYSKCLDVDIEPGKVIGTAQITELKTSHCTTFRTEFYTKVMREGETESSSWYIKGEPEVSVETNDLPGATATCAAMINRIPDVLNSEAGFITVDKMCGISYKPLPLEQYTHEGSYCEEEK